MQWGMANCLLPTPYSLLPTPYSLLPTPYLMADSIIFPFPNQGEAFGYENLG